MPDFSVVTIVKGRRKQLNNLLHSIQLSTILPCDVQVVCMDNFDGIVMPEGINVNLHRTDLTNELPLAAARNFGISASKTDNIIFIDADCIVSPTLFANMLSGLQIENIIAAYPLYLPVLPDSGDYNSLLSSAVKHPARANIPAGHAVDHLQFWSLIFAIKKQTFEFIGGFDESFVGYGAEDTDFAMMFNQAGIVQIFIPDYVLHQYHPKYDPPLNHFDDIINNATRYHQKWDILPMQRWLKAFEKMGLIAIDRSGNIILRARPTISQIDNCISIHPY